MKFISHHIREKIPAFTLIEGITLLFIFSLVAVTFFQVWTVGSRAILNSKYRLGAIALANEKMEIIRNLPYENIGEVSGSPEGDLLQEEDVTASGRVFHVSTDIEYVDDVYDGTISSGDLVWEDYKRVRIRVSWDYPISEGNSVSLVSRFVPPGLESADADHGALVINVFSDQPGGVGIDNSRVDVVNSDTGYNETFFTDSTGNVTILGLSESIQKYMISLSKGGHESISTMPPYPDTAYDPVDVHASVVAGALNVINIVQNELASLMVKTVDYQGQSIENIDFDLVGGRKAGNLSIDPFSTVWGFDVSESTNSSGEKDFGLVSPGNYEFSLDESETDYAVISVDPAIVAEIHSGDDAVIEVKLADKEFSSVLVKIIDSVSLTPIDGASVSLKDNLLFDESDVSSLGGSVFFPGESNPNPLLLGTYDLSITAPGYNDYDSQISVSGDKLEIVSVELTPL